MKVSAISPGDAPAPVTVGAGEGGEEGRAGMLLEVDIPEIAASMSAPCTAGVGARAGVAEDAGVEGTEASWGLRRAAVRR